MAYITDAAKNIDYKKKYAEYLKMMKEIAKIIDEYDNAFQIAEQKIDVLNDEIESKFLGPRSTTEGRRFLRHDRDINDPRVTLSYEDFVEAYEDFTNSI